MMTKMPLEFLSTFFLGVCTMRIVGYLFLGYGDMVDENSLYTASSYSASVAGFVIFLCILLYLQFLRLPRIHRSVREIVSHSLAALGAVSLWRLYALAKGSTYIGRSFISGISFLAATAFVCFFGLVIIIFYKEDET